jgi:hypothetical protein
MATTFSNKCAILGKLWIEYADDENLKDFVEYNDLGLPLAYAVTEHLAIATDLGTQWIEETWDFLMASLSIEDTGFDNLDEVFASAE